MSERRWQKLQQIRNPMRIHLTNGNQVVSFKDAMDGIGIKHETKHQIINDQIQSKLNSLLY